jgi:formate dehydrogenase subunit gamma
VRRFDRATRAVHWSTTVLVLGLLVTGTILYVGQLSAAIGRRALLAEIHVWCGVLLAVPLLAGIALPRAGRGLRSDLHELGRASRADLAWVRRSKRTSAEGKFNGGQKLATAAFGGLLVAQLLTGALMHWNAGFSDDWRTGATFVHDWAFLALGVLVIGHVGKAFGEPETLSAMTSGLVSVDWVTRERPGWVPTDINRERE